MAPPVTSIRTLLIANRGEIACRIARTCRRLGVTTVAVFSDADADALHVGACDLGVRLPGSAAADTYLRAELLIDAARRTGADAIHPGYGFLAESAAFAEAVLDAGLVWVGPPPAAIAAMGSKIGAKAIMRAAGVPVLDDVTLDGDATEVATAVAAIGYPVLVKASAGGGGRGMRVVHEPAALADAVDSARREATAAFGDGTLFVERFVERGRHVEVQVLGDVAGTVVALGERECSIQRRHQKIIEESPSSAVDDALRTRLTDAAIAAARAVGYVGAGTVEFLLDDRTGAVAFLEMNARLQVEHPVTELVTGLDLVELQLRIAEGHPLPPAAVQPTFAGHAIEARLTAEDPASGYTPATGTFTTFAVAAERDSAGRLTVRVDTGVADGSTVSAHYDSVLAKVIAHAPTRLEAIDRLRAALARSRLVGPTTNRDQLVNILDDADFRGGRFHTGFLDDDARATPISGDVAAAALAVWFAEHAADQTGAPVLGGMPSGWRNNPAAGRTLELRHAGGTIRVSDGPRRAGVLVDDAPTDIGAVEVRLSPPAKILGREIVQNCTKMLVEINSFAAEVVLELGGARRAVTVTAVGARRYVDGHDGHVVFERLPRHPEPRAAGQAGSLTATMPGVVRRVLAAVGDRVDAGQAVVVIEAMKMEHQISAPRAGRVTTVAVAPGQQVEAGTPLLELDA